MPGALAIVSRGLDLDVTASRQIRRASLYVGLLSLLCIGPIVAIVWAFTASQGGFDWIAAISAGETELVPFPVGPDVAWLLPVVILVGIGCLVAVAVDAQLLATVLIGAQATGRRFDLRGGLVLVRHRFWRLVRASVMSLVIPRLVVQIYVSGGRPVQTETQALLINGLNLLASVPFAYVAAGIVLGDVGAWESIRRSWRLARTRWRLAFVIAIVSTAVTYIAGFALAAGAGVLDRLGAALGLGTTTGPLQLVVLAVIVAFGLISVGSLVMTIAALTVAPQVVAFLGLTGYSHGLDDAGAGDNSFAQPRIVPLISRPMKVILVINAVLMLVVITRIR